MVKQCATINPRMISTNIAHTSEIVVVVNGKFEFMMILVGMMTPKHPRGRIPTSNDPLESGKHTGTTRLEQEEEERGGAWW